RSHVFILLKMFIYGYVIYVLGSKWHSRRKILTPTFHFNILQHFIDILIEEGESMAKFLKDIGGPVVKDLVPFASEHTLNAICETAMGSSLRNLGAFEQQYRKAVHRIGELFAYRTMRPWLRNKWIYSLTEKGKEQKKTLKILHEFTERIITERKLYHERTNDRFLKNFDNNTSAEEDKTMGIRKKRLALLDLLLGASRENLLTDLDIREEVDTFMFEGHDTTAMGICFLLLLLAEHKDIQDRVRKEVDIVMQENQGKLTMKSLQNLSYLERCIKESLRLYPSVYFISRVILEDVKLST
ncbi:PREDICTED: cytochrome P450 4C1-like, partial [Wasmannia auropunctata]|uniref:cytochrome P450 4C1-like n=1 Tax=Wasmannia auropunctata TaxID=64793 RepID=UPI0005EECB81